MKKIGFSTIKRIPEILQNYSNRSIKPTTIDPEIVARMFDNAAIVISHPDDEVLFMGSILERVKKIFMVFSADPAVPDRKAQRHAAVAEFPLDNVELLDITEAGVFNQYDWQSAEIDSYGVAIKGPGKDAYRRVHTEVRNSLLEKLSGFENVFTHNPWGEYGNEEHVLVYRVVSALSEKLGFQTWHSNYVSSKSIHLANHYVHGIWTDEIRFDVNQKLAEQIMEVYLKHSCWTWHEHWAYFEQEYFLPDVLQYRRGKSFGRVFPFNYINL